MIAAILPVYQHLLGKNLFWLKQIFGKTLFGEKIIWVEKNEKQCFGQIIICIRKWILDNDLVYSAVHNPNKSLNKIPAWFVKDFWEKMKKVKNI